MADHSSSRSRCLVRAMLGPAFAAAGAAMAPTAAASDEPQTFIDGGVTVDALTSLSGGQHRGSRLLALGSIAAGVTDLRSGRLEISGFAEVQIVEGNGFSENVVGDGQVVSNIEAVPGIRPIEAWLELAVRDGRHRIKAGLIDLNREFDMQQVGAMFLNSSHGVGPDLSQSGANGPSIFPTTTTAVVYGFEAGRLGARMGAFNAVAGDPASPRKTVVPFPGQDGLLVVAEIEHRFPAARAYAGLWGYSSAVPDILEPAGAPGQRWRGRGAYAAVEATLAEGAAGRKLDAWLRIGAANAQVLPIAAYLGGGIRYGTESSAIGLAVAHARLGDPALVAARSGGAEANRAETNLELSYLHKLTPNLTIQPDIQYVRNPGWDPTREDALVLGLRLSVGFP